MIMPNGAVKVKVTGYNNLIFEWNESDYSIANNTSTITWAMKLEAIGASGKITSNVSKTWNVVIDGIAYNGTNTIGISGNSTKVLASGNTIVTHNLDGTKSFSFRFKQQFTGLKFAGVAITDKEGSGTGTLTEIPRQATITGANDFNDESNPTITYSNPAGNAVSTLQACISLTGANADIAYRDISKTGTSYTFILSSAERDILRYATTTSNSRKITFFIKTVIGSNTFYSTAERTLTIVNATPTITPTVNDANANTIALTGDSNKLIRYYSIGSYSIAKNTMKGATVKSVSVKCGSQSKTGPNLTSGNFQKVDSGVFEFAIVDSRGNTATKTITKTMINYVPLTVNIDSKIVLSETDSTKANISFTVSGNYYNGSFGKVANSLTLKYVLKTSGNTVKEETLTIPTNAYSGTTYSITYKIPEALDYRNSYTITLQATDKITNIETTSKELKAVPIFEWGANDFQINGEFRVNNDWVLLRVADGFTWQAQPKYKVCGSIITITGCVSPTRAVNTNNNICADSIPNQYRPQYEQYTMCNGWIMSVNTEGNIIMTVNENNQINIGDILPFTITYQF